MKLGHPLSPTRSHLLKPSPPPNRYPWSLFWSSDFYGMLFLELYKYSRTSFTNNPFLPMACMSLSGFQHCLLTGHYRKLHTYLLTVTPLSLLALSRGSHEKEQPVESDNSEFRGVMRTGSQSRETVISHSHLRKKTTPVLFHLRAWVFDFSFLNYRIAIPKEVLNIYRPPEE